MLNPPKKKQGFTLFEILIAIFIFSIIGMIIASTLHNIFNTQASIEKSAKRLDQLQLAMIFVARDFQQMVNRPIINSKGQPEEAVTGTPTMITFTHSGLANPDGTLPRSTLQRTRYTLDKNNFQRITWPALDQSAKTLPSTRNLLTDVQDIQFEYLDQQNNFQRNWPSPDKKNLALPRAIRVTLTFKNEGKIIQLYVIPN